MISKLNAIPTKGKLIKNIAISFFALALILSGLVVYVTMGRAEIKVVVQPMAKEANYKILLSAAETLPSNAVAMQVQALELETTRTAPVMSTVNNEAPVGGLITVVNDSNNSQKLIARTRFLSSDEKLFRLIKPVTVPANGSVQVLVVADSVGTENITGPTKFILPGLSADLQSKIYASVDTALQPGGAQPGVVTSEDVEGIKATVVSDLKRIASEKLQAEGLKVNEDNLVVSIVSEELSAEIGDETAELTITAKAIVNNISYDESQVVEKIASTISIGQNNIDLQETDYSLVDYDLDSKSVAIEGRVQVSDSLSKDNPIFSPINFTSATPDTVKEFLLNYDGVKSVDVQISPSWQKRTPKQAERINIIVNTVQ